MLTFSCEACGESCWELVDAWGVSWGEWCPLCDAHLFAHPDPGRLLDPEAYELHLVRGEN